MNYKEPNFDAYFSNHRASKETVDRRKKEKAESDKAFDENQKASEIYKKIENSKKNFEKNLQNEQNKKRTLEEDIKNLQISINALGNRNQNSKKTLEEDLSKKQANLKSINNNIDYYSKMIKTKEQELKNSLENHKKAYNKYQKEKAEFDAAHKKALAEHKKAVDTSVEQANFNKIKNEIATIQKNIETKNSSIRYWTQEIPKEKQKLSNIQKQVNNIYDGLKLAGIELKKAGHLQEIDRQEMNKLRSLNPNDSKLKTFDNADRKLKGYFIDIKQSNSKIAKFEKNIADGKKYVSEQIVLKAKKENENINILAQAKQKGIDIKA